MFFYTKVRFTIRKSITQSVEVSFNVFHNLPKIFGMSIDEVVNNWIHRTNDFSVESLIKYIRGKDRNLLIYTETNVVVSECERCSAIHIGPVSRCGCGSEDFIAINENKLDSAVKAINLEKQ